MKAVFLNIYRKAPLRNSIKKKIIDDLKAKNLNKFDDLSVMTDE